MGACECLAVQPRIGVRRATLSDASAVWALLAPALGRRELLSLAPQNLNSMLSQQSGGWCSFLAVAEDTCSLGGAKVAGFVGVRFWTPTHAEVRTLCVDDNLQGMGLGRLLLAQVEKEAVDRGADSLFALTKRPSFFLRAGFAPTEKEAFPWKVLGDCAACAQRFHCQEVAMSKGLKA